MLCVCKKKRLNDRQVCVLSGSAASVSARAVAVDVFVEPRCRTGRSLFVSVSAPRAHSRRPRHCRPPAPAPSLLRRPRAGRRNGALAEGSATSSTIARPSGAMQKRRLGGRVSQTLSRTRTRSSAGPRAVPDAGTLFPCIGVTLYCNGKGLLGDRMYKWAQKGMLRKDPIRIADFHYIDLLVVRSADFQGPWTYCLRARAGPEIF